MFLKSRGGVPVAGSITGRFTADGAAAGGYGGTIALVSDVGKIAMDVDGSYRASDTSARLGGGSISARTTDQHPVHFRVSPELGHDVDI